VKLGGQRFGGVKIGGRENPAERDAAFRIALLSRMWLGPRPLLRSW
jgi:hypothetical protein